MRSPGAGGYDFVSAAETKNPETVLWAPHALPSVIALTQLPAGLADPRFRLPPLTLDAVLAAERAGRLLERHDAVLRIHVDKAGAEPPAVLLPLDQLFDIRAAAAIRLWRGLIGRNPGPNPAALSRARRDRLILALRALDGRLEGASYREIATALFGISAVSGRGWKSHDPHRRRP
jgi:hypothetical protein